MLSDKDIETLEKLDFYFTKKMIATMTEATKMETRDFESLYQHNYPRIKSFMEALILEKIFFFLITAFLDYLPLWKQSNGETALVVKLLESQPRELKMKQIEDSWSYDIAFNSPWACNAEIETEHLQMTQVCSLVIVTFKSGRKVNFCPFQEWNTWR